MFIKSILKKYLEHQTLGRRFICPIVQATQCNILQIDGFIVSLPRKLDNQYYHKPVITAIQSDKRKKSRFANSSIIFLPPRATQQIKCGIKQKNRDLEKLSQKMPCTGNSWITRFQPARFKESTETYLFELTPCTTTLKAYVSAKILNWHSLRHSHSADF